MEEKIDILGLSETKLTQDTTKFSFKNQDEYKVFHTYNNNSPYGSGVSILVHRRLERNIHWIEKIEGHVIAIHFGFKGKKKLSILQVYLPCNKGKSSEIQNQIKKIIGREHSKNANIIIMEDFNAVNNPIEDRSSTPETGTEANIKEKRIHKNWKPEIALFPFLEDLNFVDIHRYWEELTNLYKRISHTWSNKRASSRIDYIWLSQDLAANIHSFENKNFNHVTNSDHMLLIATIYNQDIIGVSRMAEVNRWKMRTIFDFKKMDQDKWREYSQIVEKEFMSQEIVNKIQKEEERLLQINTSQITEVNQAQLQEIWNLIENTIKKAAKSIIPLKKIKRAKKPLLRGHGHTPSFKDLRDATTITSSLKKVQKEENPEIIELINKKAKRLKKKQPLLNFENFINVTKNQEQEIS